MGGYVRGGVGWPAMIMTLHQLWFPQNGYDLLTVLNFTKDSWRATRPKGLIQKQIVKPFFSLIYLEVWGLEKKKSILHALMVIYIWFTLPKTNMSPKRGPFQKEKIVFQPLFFRGKLLSFQGRKWWIVHLPCSLSQWTLKKKRTLFSLLNM